MKTMCVRVRTKTIVERLAVRGPMGMPKRMRQDQGEGAGVRAGDKRSQDHGNRA